MRPSAATVSIGLHAAALAAVFWRAAIPSRIEAHTIQPPRALTLFVPASQAHDAGGGQRDPLPVSKGRLPPHSAQVFAPPTIRIFESPARLPVELALLSAPDPLVADVPLDRIGHPLGVDGFLSGGRGGPGGLGDGCCGGVGNGTGPGVQTSAPPRSSTPQARPSQLPRLIYKIEPEYSEDARKAKIQGAVMLSAVVDVNGRPRDIRVLTPLGLGLDEKAVEAVRLWKFQPALSDGKAVPYTVHIEVNFRLL
jgi:periplasmic protein TonB